MIIKITKCLVSCGRTSLKFLRSLKDKLFNMLIKEREIMFDTSEKEGLVEYHKASIII